MSAGYSQTPLVKKLGVKAGMRVAFVNPPEGYQLLLGELPQPITIADPREGPLDFVHFFTLESTELEMRFPDLMRALTPNGMLWVSWPKRASKIATDLSDVHVREIGLRLGLVDVKVCAVDEIWSGLKFVYRVKDRGR
ncbi:DUF3052 domain-containing protein [Capsulimonas corticalis]|uniref:DUF3052 domain-containing protein n=1 Tax=Capsulimonas corticalis TaxID=2219043 RepID=A0A9N7Q931_9BACT|nr:DUF3052 domain-containing protein [Capsulimonas corticalis]BDI29229.1 DUF3052 domain-containing protein [Capsulimonas corticalis]